MPALFNHPCWDTPSLCEELTVELSAGTNFKTRRYYSPRQAGLKRSGGRIAYTAFQLSGLSLLASGVALLFSTTQILQEESRTRSWNQLVCALLVNRTRLATQCPPRLEIQNWCTADFFCSFICAAAAYTREATASLCFLSQVAKILPDSWRNPSVTTRPSSSSLFKALTFKSQSRMSERL